MDCRYKNIFLAIIVVILVIAFLIKRKVQNFTVVRKSKIPKIIIQTWKSSEIPERYFNDISSLKRKNKDYQFIFFSDPEIETFLKTKYPEYYEIYNKLPVKIQKIDYFRYVAIYHYGGFYFDLDITGLEPLDDLLEYECIFPVDTHIIKDNCENPRYEPYCRKGIAILLGQYAFAAAPKHPFIKKLIDEIGNNINKYIEDAKTEFGTTHNYVYQSTGPDYVTDVYLTYPNKNEVTILEHEQGQYFGKYARHNYMGTWK